MSDPQGDAGTLRRILLPLIFLGLVGLAAELFLLEHTESPWQWIPFVTIGAGVVAVAAVAVRPSPVAIRSFQLAMILIAVSCLVGIYLHLSGNVAFEREADPSMGGMDLVWSSLRGATPTLAPGAMLQLGLLGLAYAYRHPVLRRREPRGRL